MNFVNRYFVASILLVLLLATSACTMTGTAPLPKSSPVAVTPGFSEKSTATLTPQLVSTTVPLNILTNSCGLLDSRDLASLFTSHTEVMLPKPQISQVNHPVFSTGNAPGTETSCVYYAFHLPGSSAEVVLQVNTWVDVPSQTPPSKGWTQDWAQAKSEAGQAISGIGDGAFFEGGRLTFKKKDLYVTVEAMETDLDLKTPTGASKQVSIEKQIVRDILSRLG